MTYMIGIGHGIALASLVALDPQPRSIGIKVADRQYGDGGAVDVATHVRLLYSALASPEEVQSVLEQCGVLDDKECFVTLYARDHAFRWKRYNGTAIQPQLGKDGGWENYFARGFAVVIRDLEILA